MKTYRSIQSTAQPDIRLSLKEWQLYIHEQAAKIQHLKADYEKINRQIKNPVDY